MSEGPISISSPEQFNSLLKSSKIVVADFYADWCGPCKQIAPLYEQLAKSLSRPNAVTFVKINSDEQTEISKEYGVSALPTFLVFKNGKLEDTVKGANPQQLSAIVSKLIQEAGPSSETWRGAEIPRGYSDITDQIERRNIELLNADEDAGPVKVLFEESKPSVLDKEKTPSKDYVQSGADDQLLLFIPFGSSVKLHTLQLTSIIPEGEDDAPARPGTIHLFINRPQNMDFSEADSTDPTQAIEIQPEDWNSDGTVSIGLRYVKFQKTNSLIIYVKEGDGEAETVRLDRVKLIGEAGPKRELGKLQKISDDE
ncbi:unnamed protein product [Clonostachys rhizophaga]|uniref:Thioredoxin n=1 Tax=Clonostachys rhizophaga TaxID=160324 RepID=A0A9N9YRZ6_9HYPO|nr:unnamed protein product [Clonostachys rhizophaga]